MCEEVSLQGVSFEVCLVKLNPVLYLHVLDAHGDIIWPIVPWSIWHFLLGSPVKVFLEWSKLCKVDVGWL